MSRLESILGTLPESVDWPAPSEHLVTRVTARIDSEKDHRAVGLRRWAWAVATAALVLVALVPDAREAVADLFQEAGVRIGFVERSATETLADVDLGEQIPLEEASAQAGLELRAPASLGTPEATYVDADVVTMVWDGPVLLTQRAGAEPYAQKGIGPATEARGVVVSGEPGLWIEGAGHTFSLLDSEGNLIDETTRLAANVLLWSVDGVDYRLELTESLGRALEIAQSLEMVGS